MGLEGATKYTIQVFNVISHLNANPGFLLWILNFLTQNYDLDLSVLLVMSCIIHFVLSTGAK